MPDEYCCRRMQEDFEYMVEEYPDRWDCDDALIGYFRESREYGVIVHDGGSSMVVIYFCPWCGTDLRHFVKAS